MADNPTGSGVTFHFAKDQNMKITLDRPLALAEDNITLVEADDPRARYTLGVQGSTVHQPDAERLGLAVDEDGRVFQGFDAAAGNEEVAEAIAGVATTEEESNDADPESKAVKKAPKDKAIKGPKETK
jgi:hypothetical protein